MRHVGFLGQAQMLALTPRPVDTSTAAQPIKGTARHQQPERTDMGRENRFIRIQSQVSIPEKAAVTGVSPV